MDEISVREYSSVETVRSIVGRSPTVDLDPALLLSSEQWNQLLKLRKRKSSKAYVFLYQIDVVSNPELEKWTENFAKKNGFKVICVREKAMGPKRWLELLKNANVVVSDSYHAVVFSLLFGISFVISSTRGAMNTRMETLLQHAGLNDRNYINIKEEEIISGIDFREVWNRLEELRGISLKRLSGIVQKIETGNEMCLN